MGRLELPAAQVGDEVQPVVLIGRHFADGLTHWLPVEVLRTGCIVSAEDGPSVPEWEPASDRVFHRASVIHRHWHADGTRTRDGEWRFWLVASVDSPENPLA